MCEWAREREKERVSETGRLGEMEGERGREREREREKKKERIRERKRESEREKASASVYDGVGVHEKEMQWCIQEGKLGKGGQRIYL